MKYRKSIWPVLLLLAAVLYALDLWHPIDRTSWHEYDQASIARNFDREGMNILRPRIDWRGDGPGYVEMEFPIVPWLMAALYKLFGQHDIIGRLLSYLFSLLALWVFFKMVRSWLDPPGSYIAAVFYIFSPVILLISNVIQPEPLMVLFDLLAVWYFVSWMDSNSWKYLIIASLATAMAILVKVSNAYIGILFLFILIRVKGFRGFQDYRTYVFGLLALTPPILWYVHAHSFWLDYGNSLGISNEYHWIGWDFFTEGHFIVGLLSNELFYIFMPSGLGVILFAFYREKLRKTKILQFGLYWLIAIFIYYLLSIRTTSDLWSMYYHCISVAPVALLFGFGINKILRTDHEKLLFRLLLAICGFVFLLSVVRLLGYIQPFMYPKIAFVVGVLSLLFPGAFLLYKKWGISKIWFPKMNLSIIVASFLIFLTLIFQANRWIELYRAATPTDYYTHCVDELRTLIPENSLILVSGGSCFHGDGYYVAHNAPYFFYWLDRQGFSICKREQTIQIVEEYNHRGADFYIAEQSQMIYTEGFENTMRANYPVIYDGYGIVLFDLRSK